MSGGLAAAIPNSPLVETGAGNVTVAWRAWFLVLQQRTGGTVGASSGDNAALIAAERGARIAADNALQAAIVAADATRAAADAAEEAARIAADNLLRAAAVHTTTLLYNEIVRATNAEALLVPKADLCSLWAACDLSFLPTSDPGNGMPWLDGNHVAVGTPATSVVGIGKEDGTGRWGLEDGTGGWIWG